MLTPDNDIWRKTTYDCASKGQQETKVARKRTGGSRRFIGRSCRRPAALGLLAGLLLIVPGTLAQPQSLTPIAPAGGEPIAPLPAALDLDADKVRLGERLFHDRRLSGDNLVACATCHRLDRGGDDGLPLSKNPRGASLEFNAPTVFNASLNFRLNWRGNFRSLEEQAEAVLLDRQLMNTTWQELLDKLERDLDYVSAFRAVYGDAPAPAHILDALATFQRSLITPNAPFDRYLRGERNAITSDERRGYGLFKTYGCAACHQGVNVGGNLFQKFGVFAKPRLFGGASSDADLGRFRITGASADRHVFRVPSLRNVKETAPYFHDGRAATLEQAVEAMAQSQLGRALAPQEVKLIAAFLCTLTGEYQGRAVGSPGKAAP